APSLHQSSNRRRDCRAIPIRRLHMRFCKMNLKTECLRAGAFPNVIEQQKPERRETRSGEEIGIAQQNDIALPQSLRDKKPLALMPPNNAARLQLSENVSERRDTDAETGTETSYRRKFGTRAQSDGKLLQFVRDNLQFSLLCGGVVGTGKNR